VFLRAQRVCAVLRRLLQRWKIGSNPSGIESTRQLTAVA
jgi:hypothetical protein